MIFSNPKIAKLSFFETHSFLSSKNLLFILYNGRSKLEYIYFYGDNINCFEDCFYTLTLNKLPLVYMQSSGCPTCEGLLAAGYGISENSLEIKKVMKNLVLPYKTLEEALEKFFPIIQLLPSGIYCLSESDYFPTDGNGHFFWDVPNEFTYFKATSEIYDSVNYDVFPCIPCYLYPSQTSDKFEQSRVDYYRSCMQKNETIPPIIAYAIDGYMSVLLDGHHRACAAALEKKRLCCFTISHASCFYNSNEMLTAISCPFGYSPDVSFLKKEQFVYLKNKSNTTTKIKKHPSPKAGSLFHKVWSEQYRQSATYFPTCEEAAALISYPFETLTKEGIEKMLNDEEETDNIKLVVYLFEFLCKQDEINKKQNAFYFTSIWFPDELRKAAFQVLDTIKDDSEIEDFFVDFIINCEDKKNELRIIADNHWNK